MSDIRMQSIFLDEEFVFEHNADVKNIYDAKNARDRISGSHQPDAKAARKEADELIKGERGNYSTSNRVNLKGGKGRAVRDIKKYQDRDAKAINRVNRQMDKNHARNMKSSHESTLMDMIDII